MNSSGQEVKDEVEAASSDEAIKKIRSKGFFPTKVKEKAAKKSVRKKKEEETSLTPKRKMPLSIGGVPRKQLVSFTRQLSTLRTPACRFCDRYRFSNSSRSLACSRRSSAASRMRSKAAARSPTRWPTTPRRSTSSTST
jgi:hypothetical protein